MRGMHLFGAAPGPVIALALVGLSLGLPILWWLLRRTFRSLSGTMQVPLHGSIYFLVVVICLALTLGGLAAVGLILTLRDYRSVGPKTFVAQLKCAPNGEGKVALEYVSVGMDGVRGTGETFHLEGTTCSLVGEVVRFRPFLTHLGLGTFSRLTNVSGQSEATGTGKGQALGPPGNQVPDFLRLERDARHPLGMLLDDARTQAVTLQPDAKAPLQNVYVTPTGYQLGPGAT